MSSKDEIVELPLSFWDRLSAQEQAELAEFATEVSKKTKEKSENKGMIEVCDLIINQGENPPKGALSHYAIAVNLRASLHSPTVRLSK